MAKVLVIDDENAIGVLMSRVIGRMGHTVEYADTIKKGLEAVHADNFDIIQREFCNEGRVRMII